MIPEEKLDRFIGAIRRFRLQLHNNKSITVHHRINDFYYLQKEEELNFLKQRREEIVTELNSVQSRINDHYLEIYCNWRKDARWLNQHLVSQRRTVNLWE